MLSLKIADQNVDLPDDFSFTMNLKSPVFGEVGSYSYPFRLPNTPRNATIMGFKHRVENTGDVYQTEQGMFLWNGLNLFEGTVMLKTLNNKSYEGSVFEREGDFYHRIKDLSLQDVDFGTLSFASETLKIDWINGCKNTVYPQRNVSFPMIQNLTYWEENPDPNDPAMNYFNYYDYIIRATSNTYKRRIIVPMLYLRYVLEVIFQKIGYTLDDSFFAADPVFNSLVLYNSVDCNTTVSGYFAYDKLKIFLNYHVPTMTINDFFIGIETFFNIRFFVNNTTKVVKLMSINSIVKSPEYDDYSKNVLSVLTEIENQITGYHLTMEMDTDDELWNSYKETQDVTLEHQKKSVLSFNDLPSWPAAQTYDTRFVRDQGVFYVFYNNVWSTFNFIVESVAMFTEFIYKDSSETISTKVSTLMDELYPPHNVVIGNSRQDWRSISPKLFFSCYQDNGGIDQTQRGRNKMNNHLLFLCGEFGLFNKYYKDYCDFRMSAKFVKITRQMTFLELKDFDFSRIIMVNGIKYLVKTLQVTIKKDRIMPALLECYTCI